MTRQMVGVLCVLMLLIAGGCKDAKKMEPATEEEPRQEEATKENVKVGESAKPETRDLACPEGANLKTGSLVEALGPQAKGVPEGAKAQWCEKDGQKHGPLVGYFKSGQKQGELGFKDGKRHGTLILWREDGSKKEQSQFKDDLVEGVSTAWDKDGKVVKEGIFEAGKCVSGDCDGRD